MFILGNQKSLKFISHFYAVTPLDLWQNFWDFETLETSTIITSCFYWVLSVLFITRKQYVIIYTIYWLHVLTQL